MKCPLSAFFCWRPSDVDRARLRAEAQADALAEAEAEVEVAEPAPYLRWTQETARAYHPSAQAKTECPDCRDIHSTVLSVLGISCGAESCVNSELNLDSHIVEMLMDLIEHRHPEKG